METVPPVIRGERVGQEAAQHRVARLNVSPEDGEVPSGFLLIPEVSTFWNRTCEVPCTAVVTVHALNVARSLIEENPLHALLEELEVQPRWCVVGAQLNWVGCSNPLCHRLPFWIVLRLEEFATKMKGRPSCGYHQCLAEESAPFWIARCHEPRDDLEVLVRLLFGPEHIPVWSLVKRLEPKRCALLCMAGNTRSSSRTIATAWREEDWLDHLSVPFKA